MRNLILTLVSLPAVLAAQTVFHVSPTGSDARSGQSEQTAFATLERARDAVRELKRRQNGTLQQPVLVYLHGGTYHLSKPVSFTAEDSGTAAAPITYQAFNHEQPVLSGGRSITGWSAVTIDSRKLWVADLPAVRDGQWYFRELFVNGQRRQRARSPNTGFYRITAVPDLDWNQPVHRGQNRFVYAPGEIQAYDNLSDVEVVILHFWISTRTPIAGVDESKNLVTLTQTASMRLTDGYGKQAQFARYYVDNAFELLDSPGEWYLNRKAGKLYYMPLSGESISQIQAVAPALEQLMTLEGDPRSGRFVEHLAFHGLTFSHAEWWLPATGPTNRYQSQGSAAVPAVIRAYGVQDCAFERCTISHASPYGIHFSRGCQRNRIVGCEFYDLGGGGIKIGEPDMNGRIAPDEHGVVHDQPSEETHDIEITDNEIHEGGHVFHQALGIFVSQCYNIHIAHNHIHDLYKNAISVGWSWNYGKSLARGNVIEWNHIHDIGKNWFNDGGAIYTLGIQPGTIIRDNFMHDIGSVVYGGRGVYLDQASAGILVERNIASHTTGGGFAQTFGKDNIVRNNIFALAKTAELEPSGGSFGDQVNNFLFEHNIVYWALPATVLRGKWLPRDNSVEMRQNLYWQVGGGEFNIGADSFAAWQARGKDAGSMVADPLFVNPDKGDFRVKPGSPALKVGFEPFDLAAVGPRNIR